MTTTNDATPDEEEEEPCQHQWRFSDSRNAFICTICYEIDEAQ